MVWRSRHLNTILSGNGPRAWWIAHKARSVLVASEDIEITCSDGVRLHGEFTAQQNASKGLVILVHGWLGCGESTYMLSAATSLYQQGYSVFRLHLRDHGPSVHLNEQPFLAIRLDEVLDAIEHVQQCYPHEKNYLVGYSLGGNIAVRAAARISDRQITLDKVVAVCPPVDPAAASRMISDSGFYNTHFVAAWRRAFEEKIKAFPHFAVHREVFEGGDVIALHEAYVPRFSDYENATEYFKAYTLNAQTLAGLTTDTTIYMAEDDPVIPVASADVLPALDVLHVQRTRYGGHCGYLLNWRLHCWMDQELTALFNEEA